MAAPTGLAVALVVLCAAGCIVGFAAWTSPGRRWLIGLAEILGVACAAGSLVVWIARWRLAGHLPLFGTYESSLSLAVAVLLAAAMARVRTTGPVGIWPVACGASAVLVGHGLRFDPTAFALTISERSWVVDVHAVLAWAAFGALTANVGFAVLRLRAAEAATPRVDRLLAYSLSLGFVLHSAMLASGSLYKFLLFGQAWSFDPIETLGFVAWTAYGTLLHMHLFAGWEGRRLATWCIGLFVILVVSYRGIVYFPAWSTYHILDMDLRMHVTGPEGV